MYRIGLACLVLVLIHLPLTAGHSVVIGHPVTRVRFDFTEGGLIEAGGRLMLEPKWMEGGTLETVVHGRGQAIQFPPVCRDTPESCPKAVLETGPAPFLNPFRKRVKWGAWVRVEPGMTTDGENIVQKGLSAESQYKLQVDGLAGQPSCVVAGTVDGVHHLIVAVAPSGIADGAWHSLKCERLPELLRLTLDGREVARQPVPAGLEIATDLPLRLGGKGIGPDNDQFHGALDEVFVEIG